MDICVTNEMIDITTPDVVEIQVRFDGKVVWINVDGICRFRACQIKTVIIQDDRHDLENDASESDIGDAGVHPRLSE